ncbi:hypothetical protein C2G38_216679 [Gigaspora rosea]|uniref:Uncharacterized protein n=1 Tax=Gigaspora rosea TaxID=44941 RepID=A0A397UIF9_9GLOM|nr:hypothetical protein C2G38_216679 [Gigaspora rosea]
MSVLKFFLDLHYNNFRNMYHSLDSVYLQIGNMPCQMRKHLRDYFVIKFVPFGGNIQDFIKPFLEEIKKLEQGFVLHLNGIDYWITGGLGIITANLLQGSDISGILCHNEYQGCRTYKVTKDKLTSFSFDIYYHGRYHQITNKEFQLINKLQKMQNYDFALNLVYSFYLGH